MKAERRQGPCPGLVLRKTTVIVFVIRGRPPKITAASKIGGILAMSPGSDKGIFKGFLKDEG
jgi:hypothetical protein